jgi:hypothetical protein
MHDAPQVAAEPLPPIVRTILEAEGAPDLPGIPSPGRLQGVRRARVRRILHALWIEPQMREQIDRAAGASNGPEYVNRLRRLLGLEIPCEAVEKIDADGRSCWPGRYSLTAEDRQKIRQACVADAQADVATMP